MQPENFEEPAGFQWGAFTNAKGADIRYGVLHPEGTAKGTMVIVPGFREPIEKYFEVIHEMAGKGFSVWVMDWHGQGGSDRFLKDDPQKMHSEGYDGHIETLRQFAEKIIVKNDGPLVLTAHSMGAHIALRCLKEHAGVFDSAILTAPMLDIVTAALPKPVARQLTRFAKAGGYLEKYIPGGGDWHESQEVFEGNKKTSDPDRFALTAKFFKEKPELQMGSATYGWVYHTFESIDILGKEDYLQSIETPVLIQISGDDMIVDSTATRRACGLLPNCTQVDMPTARHEIWVENDALRDAWMQKVDAFLETRLNKITPDPAAPKAVKKNSAPPLHPS